jgi:predicted short-subunit dehydrogenase-like oxidoreductase (DUF2520 family)
VITLGFIGAGRVGTGLAALLNSKEGYKVVAVYDIEPEAVKAFAEDIEGCHIADNDQEVADMADVVFITTVDSKIAPICSHITWRAGQKVAHVSGANSTVLLESAKKQGAYVGVFHPGFMFATAKQTVENLPGKTFDIEAEEPMLSTLKDMAAAIDCFWVEVGAQERGAFHFAEELASLYVLFMVKLATNLMQATNIPQDRAIKALLPMLHGTVNAIETLGIDQKLPGPVARYDIETIKKHIEGLRRVDPDTVTLYHELARQSIPMIVAQGSITSQQAKELNELLKS